MNARAGQLRDLLSLRPHPEGGWYTEVHRSSAEVTAGDGRVRNALTSIYFLLASGAVSRWHRVSSDEVWHWYEGDPLDLLMWNGSEPVRQVTLGPVGGSSRPSAVVPAGWWQAASVNGEYALVGCDVGPGFDFADFSMMLEAPDVDELRPLLGDYAILI